jgi:hypothetical protein
MYRRTHRALAKAIQQAGSESMMDEGQILAITNRIADVCEENTPKSATFDREVFVALATQRQSQLTIAED